MNWLRAIRWTGNLSVKNWGYESSALPYYARLSTRSEIFDETRPQNTGRNSGRVCFYLKRVSIPSSKSKDHQTAAWALEGFYRYRVGRIRIVYSVDETARTIEIVNIDDRGDVYK